MSDLDRLKTHVTDAVDRMAEDLWSLALQIHANPELAFKEEKAASWLTAFLERQGCRVERGVGGPVTRAVLDCRHAPHLEAPEETLAEAVAFVRDLP